MWPLIKGPTMPLSTIQCFFSRVSRLDCFCLAIRVSKYVAIFQENDLKCDSQLAPNAFLTYALILWKQIKPWDKCTTQNIPRHAVLQSEAEGCCYDAKQNPSPPV